MSVLSPSEIDLYQKMLRGDHHLIGWGVRDFFGFQRWQEKFPLKMLVDANYRLWDKMIEGFIVHNPMSLEGYAPQDHSIINYYRTSWVKDYVSRHGDMNVIQPLPLQHICRGLKGEAKDKVCPMPEKEWRALATTLSPCLSGSGAITQSPEMRDILGRYDWRDCVAGIAASTALQDNNENTVVLVSNSLCPGGAERQIVNLATGFIAEGWLTHHLSIDIGRSNRDAPHYIDVLQQHSVSIHHVLDATKGDSIHFAQRFLADQPESIRLALWHLPIDMTLQVASSVELFQRVKPKLVIAYLDWSSCIAGLAALLCGVPHIVVSGRNYPPPFFPQFFLNSAPVLHDVYQILLTNPRVRFTNNARAAGDAYAKWLGAKKSSITFVPNCLSQEFTKNAPQFAAAAARERYGIDAKDKLVLGVFRLSPEKRPEKFLSVVATLIKKDKKIRAVICGDGILRAEMERLAKKKKIDRYVTFAGNIEDISAIMGAADLLLHTARHEGMPNVILEAQAQGLPVICTISGGVMDCLAPGLRLYAFAPNDWAGVTKAAAHLLARPTSRKQIGKAAQQYVRRNFSIARLTTHTLATAGINPKKRKK